MEESKHHRNMKIKAKKDIKKQVNVSEPLECNSEEASAVFFKTAAVCGLKSRTQRRYVTIAQTPSPLITVTLGLITPLPLLPSRDY